MKVAYISGPMRGHPQANFASFRRAEEFLLMCGYMVINPAAHKPDVESATRKDHQQALRKWAQVIVGVADLVYVLNGWTESLGARFEVNLALDTGVDVQFEDEDED